VSVAKKIVVLSAYHDYRTAKRASIHQVARALAKLGHDVSFISMRFSHLSRWKGDSRLALSDRSNRIEMVDEIKCYLWRTMLHPFASNKAPINAMMGAFFEIYAQTPNKIVDQFLSAADYVIIESSVAAIFVRRIHRLNQQAHIIYYATDLLDTVGAHPFVQRQLEKDGALIGHVSMRSPRMMNDFKWAGPRRYRAEFGVDVSEFSDVGQTPYAAACNVVSVGSMLFDPSFFQAVAPSFPDVTFHVIGCGMKFSAPENVIIYDEMRFRDTLAYLKYATIGVAPYRPAPGTEYLAESSLKLAQFEYFGLPSVCPDFAVGTNASRVGYQVNDVDSMCRSLSRALEMVGTVPQRQFQSWEDVAARVLTPQNYPDTAILS
jgi:2-beta-glucuronyltransferase